jgi:hypothetical protein
MLSGRVMLVSSQCHCNSLNVSPKRCGGDTDFGSEMLNLANPYSEAVKTSQALPRLLLEIPDRPRRHLRDHGHWPACLEELRKCLRRYKLGQDRIGDDEG